jgi:hypothetical protein
LLSIAFGRRAEGMPAQADHPTALELG